MARAAAAFAQSFSRPTATALRMSERSIQVQVAAGIGLDIRERIARAPIADKISELGKRCSVPAFLPAE